MSRQAWLAIKSIGARFAKPIFMGDGYSNDGETLRGHRSWLNRYCIHSEQNDYAFHAAPLNFYHSVIHPTIGVPLAVD